MIKENHNNKTLIFKKHLIYKTLKPLTRDYFVKKYLDRRKTGNVNAEDIKNYKQKLKQ